MKKNFFINFYHANLYVPSYVVEDKPNNITDRVSFRLFDVSHTIISVRIDAVVFTQSPIKQLITDALVCARENGASTAVIAQRNYSPLC